MIILVSDATFDVRAWWIVPQAWLHDVDYRELSGYPNHVFDKTMFDMSAFVVRGFDVPAASLISDLELIESRLVQPHAQAGGFLLELIQASYLNVGPMRLAQIAGCRYHSMLFFEDGPHNGWYVDIDPVERATRQLL